ncbi:MULTISPECIES: Fic family protein [unclassified Treponema]|uniref:Fic family protein n=1 Tax=unclassified Treponema TaxID=2638727 RepID=UPI0020A3FCF9|nr:MULTISPECIES: Fic family protein [unclassified Treponema]UTC66767.1 Fic family protein [Treponema sp. OMZ 789]UTC69500.1 Fic family protein [Treponema sp. OMZ 790]UTC72214.1 Fic family protein [Treponema sp. OMZ 791]
MDLKSELLEIDKLKAELDLLRPLSVKQLENLKRLFDVDFTYNSTAIEGNTYNLQETRIVLLDGITIGGKSAREHLEIVNHKEAIDYIEKLSKKNLSDFTRNDILNIHHLILKGIDTENAGIFRKVPVYVRLKNGAIHKFCDPLKILDEMDNYFNWLFSKKEEHPVLIAAEAHTKLVSIHPFIDGNGRTARLIMNLILIRYGFPPAVIKVSLRNEYLNAIENWQQNNNEIPFKKLLIASLKESLEIYLDTLKNNIIWK